MATGEQLTCEQVQEQLQEISRQIDVWPGLRREHKEAWHSLFAHADHYGMAYLSNVMLMGVWEVGSSSIYRRLDGLARAGLLKYGIENGNFEIQLLPAPTIAEETVAKRVAAIKSRVAGLNRQLARLEGLDSEAEY